MKDELATIYKAAIESIASAHTPDEIETLRIQYLGRKGALTIILRSLKDISPEDRKTIGEEANKIRAEIESRLNETKIALERTTQESVLKKEWVDVTYPGIRHQQGTLHPLTQIRREVESVFAAMGFETVEGPDVETEHYNFDALNIPQNHPARDMWDTFWIKEEGKPKKQGERLLLRTHTSPVQIRYMEEHNPPIRIIVPGNVYRYEATDASHEIQFPQIEGLMVDRAISVANFKYIIQTFFSRLFKENITIRLRPSYFPFTEPSFEMDISCIICKSSGCPVCKQSGWLELGGAGMVHPNVFKAVGYNPNPPAGGVQGFAFGMGISRIAMMKYKIPDIRLFLSGDLRFLKQFN